MAASTSAQQKQMPKDALVIISILKELGITDYEPRVVNQLLEFMYRYTTSVLEDAKVYSNHAKKKTIDLEDVRLAVQMQLDKSFTSPPSRDILLEIARAKNSSPLPFVKPHCGIRLPPDRYCLNSCNYRLKSIAPKKFSHSSLSSGGYGSKMGLGKGPAAGSTLQMGKRGPASSSLTTVPRTQSLSAPKPVIKFSSAGFPGGSLQSKIQIGGLGGAQIKVESEDEPSLKRKRESDDFGSMDTN